MAQNPSIPDATSESSDVREDLRQALDRDEFFLVYQPEIDLRTNGFAGVEALIRWRHPRRGVITPDVFLAELERSGQIVDVGRWALTTACLQGVTWHDKGYRFAVSVNISDKQFERPDFIDDVESALNESRLDPALLVLEFSQSTLSSDAGTTTDRLARLKKIGVRLAVDDFTPGRSELSDLERLPLDIVKLDREFIAKISGSPDAANEVHSLVQLAKTRALQITASGVEDAVQRKRLQLEEVDTGQGFLFSKPHEVEEIDRFLEDFSIFSGKPL